MLLALFFTLAVALYLYAIFSTFTLEWHGPEPLLIATLILAAGFGVLILGYGSVVVIGGALSLGLAVDRFESLSDFRLENLACRKQERKRR